MKEYIAVERQTDSGGYIEIVSELVRCKDCKYYEGNGHYCDFDRYAIDSGYCYCAEREDE